MSQSFDDRNLKFINKAFLANTILQTEAHNRREEIEDCWRQHKLQKTCQLHIDKNDSYDENGIKIKTDENSREYWMKRKVSKAVNFYIEATLLNAVG